jgi:hypothetical protein
VLRSKCVILLRFGSQMSLTAYHARYFAHELTKRSTSASIDSLTSALADAQVDLNPHQVEAALFAFRSPLSRGAILADEVGLGKTIEAGILLSQRWAERRRHLLVICPANLRKQWGQELADKFFLPYAILETKTFNEEVKRGNLNPFDQPKIVLCSFQFARTKDAYVRQTPWDLVVIDEAHRLRNVYKANNKIANAIKAAISDRPKTLLTATPLQNSLLELYGLVSIIDEFTFGDLRSFRSQFTRMNTSDDCPSASGTSQLLLDPINDHTTKRLQVVRVRRSTPFAEQFLPLLFGERSAHTQHFLQRPQRSETSVAQMSSIEIQNFAQLTVELDIRRGNCAVSKVANQILDMVASIGWIAGEVFVTFCSIAMLH